MFSLSVYLKQLKAFHIKRGDQLFYDLTGSNLLKKTFDTFAALIGLLVLAPFFALIALLIKRDTPGPVFYWGPRMGRGERPFKMLKFRTMYETPSSYKGPRVTCKADDRITPFGHWLRDSKINELPQLWNVLVGDMSMVGPRPEDPDIVKNWPADSRREILSIKPGITSPASILYHDEEAMLSATDVMDDYIKSILPDKMRLDRLYVRSHSFWADLDIIFWTLAIIWPNLIKTTIPEGYLFAGLFFRLIHRYVSWLFIDVLSSMIAAGLVGSLWRMQEPLNWGIQYFAYLAVFLAFLFSGFNALLGINRIEWSRASIEDSFGLIFSGTVITIFILFLNYLQSVLGWLSFPALPMTLLLSTGLMAMFGFIMTRYRNHLIKAVINYFSNWRRSIPQMGERVLIVGSGEGCELVNWLLRRKRFEFAFNIIGMVDDDIPHHLGMQVNGCHMLGNIRDLTALVQKYDVGLILFTTQNSQPGIIEEVRKLQQTTKTRIVFMDRLIKSVEQHFYQANCGCEDHLIVENERETQPIYDELTGLPNQALFKTHLKHSLAYARRYKTNLAVLFIQLENIESILAQGGEETLHALIKEVARRLTHCIRESDTLSRLDDNEFALLLDPINDQTLLSAINRRVLNSFNKPFVFNERSISICISLRYFLGDDFNQEMDHLENLRKQLFNTREVSLANTF